MPIQSTIKNIQNIMRQDPGVDDGGGASVNEVGTKFGGKLVGDVTITREEIDGLKSDLLCTNSPPAGNTKLTDWAREHAAALGTRYASELARRKNRAEAYDNL